MQPGRNAINHAMNVDPSYPPCTHCTSRALSPPAARPAAHNPPIASKRAGAARPQPSLSTRQPRRSPQNVTSPLTRHTCRPYVDPMSPYVTPMSTQCRPMSTQCRPLCPPATSCHEPPHKHPVTKMEKTSSKHRTLVDIGRLRYPIDALPLHRRRPRLQPSAPPTAKQQEPPGQARTASPAPRRPHQIHPPDPSRHGTARRAPAPTFPMFDNPFFFLTIPADSSRPHPRRRNPE